MLADQWIIGSHTAHHLRLSECSNDQVNQELTVAKERLLQNLSIKDIILAFPFGDARSFSNDTIELAKQAGYSACLSSYGGENWPDQEYYLLKRIDIGSAHPTVQWKAGVHGLNLRDVVNQVKYRNIR